MKELLAISKDIEEKGYTNKSNAVRRAKTIYKKTVEFSKGVDIEKCIDIVLLTKTKKTGSLWYLKLLIKKDADKLTISKVTDERALELYEIKVSKGHIFSSVTESACSLVHDICYDLRGKDREVSRKAIVEACVEAGVATYTAQTQYQRWLYDQKISKSKQFLSSKQYAEVTKK